jgi:hypothetical protein
MQRLAAFLALGLAACATAPQPRASVDEVARDYVRMALEIDAHESGFVDAYYGPAEWREAARKNPRGQAELKREADRLLAALRGAGAQEGLEAQRVKVLAANIASARFRLDMIGGTRVKFADEAERLFALRPKLKPLRTYDAALARVEAIAPGPGPLSGRIAEFRSRYSVPEDKLPAVVDAAIAECRKRTARHIVLPQGEDFQMELVKGKSWGAYNYYKGDNQSLIQVNTDLPVLVGNVLTLGCHEGYPGHHVQGIFMERAYRERGWAEFSVLPLYIPAAPLNEGGGDFGLELAFPGDERLKFEMETLYPLAGIDPAKAPAYDELRKAMAELDGAALTISQMYLDGEVDRSAAVGLIQRYELVGADVAEHSLTFEDQYRSYVINYSSGEDVVRAYVDRAGSDPAARWKAYEYILSTPVLPSDLAK